MRKNMRPGAAGSEQEAYNPQSEVFRRCNSYTVGCKQGKEVLDTGVDRQVAASVYATIYEQAGYPGDEDMYLYILGVVQTLHPTSTAEARVDQRGEELGAIRETPVVFPTNG